jgi:hypothetical protein
VRPPPGQAVTRGSRGARSGRGGGKPRSRSPAIADRAGGGENELEARPRTLEERITS